MRGEARFVAAQEIRWQRDKAMIRSSHRDRKAKAIAEVLAMIADGHPPITPHRPPPDRETEEGLFFDSATEFIEALNEYYAKHASQIKRESH